MAAPAGLSSSPSVAPTVGDHCLPPVSSKEPAPAVGDHSPLPPGAAGLSSAPDGGCGPLAPVSVIPLLAGPPDGHPAGPCSLDGAPDAVKQGFLASATPSALALDPRTLPPPFVRPGDALLQFVLENFSSMICASVAPGNPRFKRSPGFRMSVTRQELWRELTCYRGLPCVLMRWRGLLHNAVWVMMLMR